MGDSSKGRTYALAVRWQEQVDVADKRVRVDDRAQERAQEEWQRYSADKGAKGPRWYDWMRIEREPS